MDLCRSPGVRCRRLEAFRRQAQRLSRVPERCGVRWDSTCAGRPRCARHAVRRRGRSRLDRQLFLHDADLLRHGRLVAAFRRYVDVARSEGRGWTSAMFLRGGVWPLLPPGAKRAVRGMARRWRPNVVPAWIAAPFAQRTALADRLRRDPVPDRLPLVARYDVVQQYRSALGTGDQRRRRASLGRGRKSRIATRSWIAAWSNSRRLCPMSSAGSAGR